MQVAFFLRGLSSVLVLFLGPNPKPIQQGENPWYLFSSSFFYHFVRLFLFRPSLPHSFFSFILFWSLFQVSPRRLPGSFLKKREFVIFPSLTFSFSLPFPPGKSGQCAICEKIEHFRSFGGLPPVSLVGLPPQKSSLDGLPLDNFGANLFRIARWGGRGDSPWRFSGQVSAPM